MRNGSLQEQVDWLINTSVDDLQSSLYAYSVQDLNVLRKAYARVKRRGEKTKAKVLASKIRKLEKEQPFKAKLSIGSIELTVEVED